MEGSSGSNLMSMSDVVSNTAEAKKARDAAIKANQKRQEEIRRQAEQEARRRAKEIADELKKAEEKAAKEAEEAERLNTQRKAKLRYEAYKEAYPAFAEGVNVRGGSTADKYNEAVDTIKLKRTMQMGPDTLHMGNVLACSFYTKMIAPTEVGGWGVNPFDHAYKAGNLTFADFVKSDDVKNYMRPTYTEIIAEYPDYFISSPVWLNFLMGMYGIMEQFTAKAKMINAGSSYGQAPPARAPTPPPPEVDAEYGNMDLNDFDDL